MSSATATPPAPAKSATEVFGELLAEFKNVSVLLTQTVANKAAADNEVTALKSQLTEIKSQMEQIQRGTTVSLPGVEDEAKKKGGFSFLNVCRGIANPSDKKWQNSMEKSMVEEATRKGLDSGNGSTGGFLIPTELLGPIFDKPVAQPVLERLGATRITFDGQGNIDMARETGTSEAYWTDETAAAQETTNTFEQFNMAPKRLSAFMKLGRRFLAQASGMQAENYVRRRLQQAFARKIDYTGFFGTGTDAQPKGIIALIGTGRRIRLGPDANTGKSFLLGDKDKLVGLLEDADALDDNGRLGFVAHPRVWRGMRNERIAQFSNQTEGAYVLMPMNDQALAEALGYPLGKSTQFPTNLTKGSATGLTYVIFGDFSRFLMGQWMSLVLRASDTAGNATGSAFLQNQLWIVGDTEMDMNVERIESFAYSDDIITPAA